MSNQLQITGGAKVRNLEGVITGSTGVLSSLPINGSNGIPQLDSSGKILVSQLPNSVMEYQGTWNVATNTPYLVNGVGNAGDVYLVTGAATGGTNHNFGAGNILFYNGDQTIYDGSAWQRASGSTGTVTSVAVTESSAALNITGSPITTSGTINIGFAGTSAQYVAGDGSLITFPALTGYVPYTGATSDLNLGTHNYYGNNYFDGFTSVASSTTPIVLTINSTPSYLVTGSGGQTIKLPDATTLPNGAVYSFNNNQTTGAISVNNNSNTLVKSVPSGAYLTLVLTDNTSAAGSWDAHFEAPSNVSWSTNTFDYAGSFTSGTWNGNVIAINRGGTGASTAAGALSNLGGIGLTSLSASSPLSYNNTTGVFSISQSTTSTNGYLSSTDWNTFNNKLSTTTATSTYVPYTGANNSLYMGSSNIVSAKSFVTSGSSGGAYVKLLNSLTAATPESDGVKLSSVGSVDLVISSNSYNSTLVTSGNTANRTYTFPNVSGTLALTSDLSGYVPTGFLNATNPLFYSATYGTFSIQVANTSQNGYLTSTDWTTFNNKQSALTNPVTGTGTTNYLPKFTSTSTIGNSLVYDNGTNVGIGTTSPSKPLEIYQSGSNTAQFKIGDASTSKGYLGVFSNSLYISAGGTYSSGWSTDGTNGIANIVMETSNGGSAIAFGTASSNTSPSERMRVTSGGNLLVGTTTDNGAKLQVNGTITTQGQAWKINSAFAGTPAMGGNVLSISINGTTYYIQLYTTTL